MTEPRSIATVRDYDGLVAAVRARAEALNVSRATIDDVSGMPSGYTGKLLATPPIKNLGAISLGPILGALGLAIVLVEDAEQMRRIATRMSERNKSQVRVDANASSRVARWLFNPRRARGAAKKRWLATTPEQRKRIAKKAWKTRRERAKKAKQQITATKAVPAAPRELHERRFLPVLPNT